MREDPAATAQLAHSMRTAIVRSEGSVILIFGAAIIASFDFAAAATGTHLPNLYIYLDGLQCVGLVVLGLALRNERLPNRLAPWVFAAGITLNTAVSNYGATVVGTGSLASILVMLVLLGAVISFWVPFIVGAAACVGITAAAVQVTVPDQAVTWAFAALTAIAFSAMVLRGRAQTVRVAAETHQRMRDFATRDALTGMLNRRGVGEVWPMLTARAARVGAPMFAIFIDVAGLKHVNDSAGHELGDVLLMRIAAAIRLRARGDELLARWGGDEFLVLGVGEAPERDAFGTRLLDAIEAERLDGVWKPRLWIGTAQADAGVPLSAIVSEADAHTALCPSEAVR